jgi:hypothetical protein
LLDPSLGPSTSCTGHKAQLPAAGRPFLVAANKNGILPREAIERRDKTVRQSFELTPAYIHTGLTLGRSCQLRRRRRMKPQSMSGMHSLFYVQAAAVIVLRKSVM